ncbi:aldehyde oxidase 3 [Alligator sinensis]|uniref:aldehyde oxidase n=1 Tax=Alligator sinensis TaxID=38654 RepID=A0A1U8DBZ9_ALLSI|nr:aldehyde oxidase 3 [Alligator sinensis]
MACPPQSDELIFFVNGRKMMESCADPEEELLSYLRKGLRLTGTKKGCGIGGCGACTVMISTYDPVSKKILHYPANSCLLPICSLHGTAVTTVEGVGSTKTRIHPIQERLAKCHGSQCGFCTPGMVMSMYALLRNHPEPSMEQITAALDGNLCRCTGYRPIIESYKSFAGEPTCCQLRGTGQCCLDQEGGVSSSSDRGDRMRSGLCNPEEFQPADPSQEFIFPPELMRMAQEQQGRTLFFQGERTTWISPASLRELLELKTKYPKAPVVVGNTSVGLDMKLGGVHHPVILHPDRIPELRIVSNTNNGLMIGAACRLAQLRDILMKAVSGLPEEKTKIFYALLQQLRTLAGEQIRSLASLGGHIVSRGSTWDLNPVLAVGNSVLNLASTDGKRQIPLTDDFLSGCENADIKPNEVIVSVLIPYSKKDDFVSAFRQAERRKNALSIVNSAMRVLFKPGTNIIMDLNILYGGIGSTTVSAKKSCQKLIRRQWNEQMLGEACRLVLGEIFLSPSAPGGKVEYRRTLLVSFLFKFYLEVLHGLKMMDPSKYPDLPKKYMSALRNFECRPPQGRQVYQDVDPGQPPQDPVGHPIMHQSGVKHATGEAVYCDDMHPVDGELSLAVVKSSKAHAKIVSIDASEAFKVPGVVDVVTASDVPGENGTKNEKAFAGEEVICVGQIICAVVAESDIQAKRGAEKVKIQYEELEPILTIEDAIRHNSYIGKEKKVEKGNIERGFNSADEIIEGKMTIGGQEHFYLEPNSVLVVPRGEDNEMDVYSSTQYSSNVQELVASALDVQSNKIMCHTKRVGGAFGGKVTKPSYFAVIAAVAANKTGRPVRFILERHDDMLIVGNRHPFLGKYKVGFMNDGRIVAADIQAYINAGCTPDESEMVIAYIVLKMDNAYKIPNFRVRGRACKTHLPSNTAFRGFGFPQSGLFAETWVIAVATQTGLPPEKVRDMNMYEGVNVTPFKEQFDATNLRKCWTECLEKSEYYSRKTAAEEFNKQNYWKKKGIAIIPMKFTAGFNMTFYHQAAALVHIYTDGSVLVTHGGVELGQGIHTKMLQVASRELKVPLSYIHLCETSTTTVPNALVTAGSVGSETNGKAVQDACQILRKRLEPIIQKNPEGKWEDWVKEAFKQSISLSATGYFRGYDGNMNWEKGEGHPFTYFVYGAACSEVAIDCLTGDHKNLRTDIVMDIGCSINPAVDIGQIEGAFVQGIGLYTLEELNYSPKGVLHTRGPDHYKIPAVCDIPEQFSVSLLSPSQNPHAIYASKGVGEAGLFLGCSVFFALRDAVSTARKERGLPGAFTLNSPLTPERIRMACADDFTQMVMGLYFLRVSV